MSSMKAEAPVIRSAAHNLLLQWMEYLLLQLPLVEPKRNFDELYQRISINLIRKKHVFWLILFKNTSIVSCESWYIGSAVSMHIVVTKYWYIAMHRWIVAPLVNIMPADALAPQAISIRNININFNSLHILVNISWFKQIQFNQPIHISIAYNAIKSKYIQKFLQTNQLIKVQNPAIWPLSVMTINFYSS